MKYSIMHVNDRAKEKMENNKKILLDLEYVEDIEYFNGNVGNAWDVLNHMRIDCGAWKPYDGREFPALPGEYGVWLSTIRVWQYIIDNKIDMFLLLEDDISLQQDFIKSLNDCINDLPSDFDFLSLYYFDDQNQDNDSTEIQSTSIKKSHLQYSAGQATLYSLAGAKKLMKLIKRKGLEYTSDCFIFKQSQLGLVQGYSIKGHNNKFLIHEYSSIKSLIDPDNLRNTDIL